MNSDLPKFNLIYYKALLDEVFIKFFEDFNDSFYRNSVGTYIFSSDMTRVKLFKTLKSYFIEELKKIILPWNILKPEYYIIIGACMPKDNILLQCKKSKDFPKKLEKLLKSDKQVKYVLKESGIHLDLILFNEMFIDIFNDMFSSDKTILKNLGKDYKNIFFVTHNKLDCYAVFKSIKFIYGKSNCINLKDKTKTGNREILVAINELIDRYIEDKVLINANQEFKTYVSEIKQFIDEKIKRCQLCK